MKRVAQVIYSGLGGHGSVALSLLDAVDPADWTGQLVFFGIEPVVGEYVHACRERSIETCHVPSVAGRAWRSWPALYRALRRFRPDVLIVHSVKTILPCALYARLHRIPLVAVEHQPNALKHPREWRVSWLLMRLADAVVVLSADYRDQLRQHLGCAWIDAKVHLIPNGIDTRAFAPRGRVGTGRPWMVGMAARMSSTKRQDLLIDAIARLAQENGSGRWRLTLAGDGENAANLRDRVRHLGLEDVVSFPGYLDARQLQQWFASIDFYAHASEGETLSTSLLQAMAVGLPIVGSDVLGISNLLSSAGGVGLLAAQSPEAFAARLRALASDPALATSLGQRARQCAEAEYSHESMFERYRSLVDRLCAG